MAIVGESLRRRRQERGLSQEELSPEAAQLPLDDTRPADQGPATNLDQVVQYALRFEDRAARQEQ
jgi:hypothetical protein